MRVQMRFKRYEEIENAKQLNINTPAAQTILSVARQCFMEKEYNKVTFREIADRAKVTSGLIAYYFESKDRLAAQVSGQYLEEEIQKMDMSAMSGLDSAERFYTVVFLEWLIIDKNPDFARFYYSYNKSTPGQFWENGKTYTRLVREFLDEYNLDVSERQNEIYLIACRGSTRELLLHRHEHPNLISREVVMDITTSNYFYNLGMSDKVIYRVIQNSKAFLEKYYPDALKEEA
ncbi:TetR family transcriptional regulator [Clostridium sp. MCC353]|nr:TetR family transcriptional regulator [Clostridium sp. MCC353]